MIVPSSEEESNIGPSPTTTAQTFAAACEQYFRKSGYGHFTEVPVTNPTHGTVHGDKSSVVFTVELAGCGTKFLSTLRG